MEDFQRKRQYLNHLKQISAIKNGHYKSSLNLSTSRLGVQNSIVFKDNNSEITNSSRYKIHKKKSLASTSRAQTTQQIMKNYYMQKQNLRLVGRISGMSSQINVKKYQKQYLQHKKLMRIHSKFKKQEQHFSFKIFDIQFLQNVSDPAQIFQIYEISQQKKKFLVKGNIFELRKQQLRTKKDESHQIKIEGKSSGIVQIKMKSMLPIKRNKYQVGNIIIDII